MPLKPLPNDNVNDDEDNDRDDDLFDDAKSWFIKLFGFAQLDSQKFPPVDYKLSAEFSRDKDYLYVFYKTSNICMLVCIEYVN